MGFCGGRGGLPVEGWAVPEQRQEGIRPWDLAPTPSFSQNPWAWFSLEPPQPSGLVSLSLPPRLPLPPPPRQLRQPQGHLGLDPAQPEQLLVPEPGGPQRGLLYPLWRPGRVRVQASAAHPGRPSLYTGNSPRTNLPAPEALPDPVPVRSAAPPVPSPQLLASARHPPPPVCGADTSLHLTPQTEAPGTPVPAQPKAPPGRGWKTSLSCEDPKQPKPHATHRAWRGQAARSTQDSPRVGGRKEGRGRGIRSRPRWPRRSPACAQPSPAAAAAPSSSLWRPGGRAWDRPRHPQPPVPLPGLAPPRHPTPPAAPRIAPGTWTPGEVGSREQRQG